MKLGTTASPVTSAGAAGAASAFGIAMNGKAFRVLSDTMYQDKIGSIVREVSCNALDSHIAAGIPERPIEIHVPDAMEPWLSIRDFGVGLSPEDIATVFCVYFQSTKDHSNDAIGAFGLGAKTPFSYTDQFNVTSNYNGRCYMYSAYISETDMPEIQLMAETETDEPNGVEIKIGVETKDYHSFRNAIFQQLRFFPVKPILHNFAGSNKFEEERKLMFGNERVKIYHEGHYSSNNLHIVQGPVGYPLDISKISSFLSMEERRVLSMLNQVKADIYFNIGEIAVTASREGMEYRGITIDSIRKRIIEIKEDIKAWLDTSLENFTLPYDKAKFLNENTFLSKFADMSDVTIPGAEYIGYNYVFSLDNCENLYKEVTSCGYDGKERTSKVLKCDISYFAPNGGVSATTSRTRSGRTLHPSEDNNVVVVIRDLTRRKVVARMRHYFDTHRLSGMHVIIPHEGVEFTDADIAAISETLGGFDRIVRASEMPEPPKAEVPTTEGSDGVREPLKRATVYRTYAGTNFDSRNVDKWERVTGRLSELKDSAGNEIKVGYYVTVERKRVLDTDLMRDHLYNLRKIGKMDFDVYAVREADIPRLKKDGTTWIRLSDYVKEQVESIKNDPALRRWKVVTDIKEAIDNYVTNRYDSIANDIPQRSAIARLNRIGKRAERWITQKAINQNAAAICDYTAESHPAFEVVNHHIKTMFDKTPLLRTLSRYSYGYLSDEDSEYVKQYVTMCYR